jgi:hypothetical protein
MGCRRLGSLCSLRFPFLTNDDFADLHYRCKISVVRDVGHDCLGVRAKTFLEGLDRITKNMAHSDVSRGSARGATRQAFINRVRLATVPHQALEEGHMFVTVVGVVKPGAGSVGVHHAGELKIIAAILERPAIEKILTHLGLEARAPPRSPARGQMPLQDF